MKKTIFLTLFLVFGLYMQGQYQPRLNFNAKFEEQNKILHGSGQSRPIEYSSYAAYMGNNRYPEIAMFYTTPDRTPQNMEETINRFITEIDKHPNGVMLQIGFQFSRNQNPYADEVIAGMYDASIIKMAQVIQASNKKAFVRIGHEANGFWRNYDPNEYIQAFKHITNLFRQHAPNNIATVWNMHPTTGINDMLTYYPGDNYVDWWAINLFEPVYITGNKKNNTFNFLNEAVQHSKPVMIAESCPVDIGVNGGQQSWDDWFNPIFNIIKNYPVIKAFCYINRNWKPSPTPNWEDGRIFVNNTVFTKYKNELSNNVFNHLSVPNNYRIAALQPTDDSYVRDGSSSNTVFGNIDPLRLRAKNASAIGFNRETYLKFDISGISNIEHARVYLFADTRTGTADFQTNMLAVSDNSWNENTLTYNNKPQTGTILTSVVSNRDEVWNSFEVKSYVISNQGNSSCSVALKNNNQDNQTVNFDSKETINGNIPFLIIHYQSGASNTQITVSSSSDDAEESANGTMKLNSGDLDFGTEPMNAVRFRNLDIPQNSFVQSAYIQFSADDANQGQTSNLLIQGQDVNDAPTFNSSNSNISNRPVTSASINWTNINPWSIQGQSGPSQRTPDISSILQEIVNRGGWQSGNDLVFFISGNSGRRSATTYDGNPNKAPKLIYSLGGSANAMASINFLPDTTSKLMLSGLTLFPNPVEDQINLILPSKGMTVLIHNFGGELIKEIEVEGTQASISSSGMRPGIYLLSAGEEVVKFIVK